MEPASKRSMVSAARGGLLPPDVLWEILLRVPAKPLCCFRAACRLWLSLLSDPSFIKAHTALHPDLILALAGDNDRIDMTDLSGNVVRQISITAEDIGVPRNLHHHVGPLYLLQDHNRVRLLDLDTGGVSTLPLDDLQRRVGKSFEGSYALGRVASTGQRKLLRVVSRYSYPANQRIEQHCDVLTLGDDDRRCWRRMASAPLCVKYHITCRRIVPHSAVIQGVVYFLPDKKFPIFDVSSSDNNLVDTNCVMSFDLEAEEWRPEMLPGPAEIDNTSEYCILKLAKLKSSLVMIRLSNALHGGHSTVEADMWFATDLEKGVWVKKRRIRLKKLTWNPLVFALDLQVLRILDDGRVVFYYSGNYSYGNRRLWIYDPRTKSSTDVPQHGACYIAGMYGGSMMCLESR